MRILVASLLLFWSVFSAATQNGGLKDGFRSFSWGSEPLALMFETDSKANMKGYMRRGEDLMVLGTKASDINYYYYGGGLCRIEVGWWPQTPEIMLQILKGLERSWGSPRKTDNISTLHNHEWASNSGKTIGRFIAMEDVQTKEKDWMITIIIQGSERSASAMQGQGL